MGIYSLENFEKYKTKKVRPKLLTIPPSNKGYGKVNYIKFNWNELEAVRGEYNFQIMEEVIKNTWNPVLILSPNPPSWVNEHHRDCFAALIRKVGSCFDLTNTLLGIVATTIEDSLEEWKAYLDSFNKITIFADIFHTKFIRYLRNKNRDFGLLVTCNEENWIDCCEAFAREDLQDTWKKSPVLIHITDDSCGPSIMREANRWHASLSNLDMNLGANLTIRRITYPEVVSSEGVLPLRLWIVNNGSSKLYDSLTIRLQLCSEFYQYNLIVNADTKRWLTGDITHNEILKLPKAQPGEYKVKIGLFYEDNSQFFLNLQNSKESGYYEIGTIQFKEDNQDNLLNIWDHYYPDGYYPLEDPKSPED